MQLKKISVITVSFNSVKFIEKTITSVLEQTYQNIEYLVIDGLSSDGTIDIIKKYHTQINYWHSEKDESMYDAINKGLARCSGDYVWILNSDDYIPTPNTVTEIMKLISTHPECLGYYGNIFILRENDIRLRRTFQTSKEELLLSTHGTFVPHPSLIVSTQSFKFLPSYDLQFKYASDYDYILTLMGHGTLKFIDLPFTVFRQHSNSITSSGKIDSERQFILSKHGYYNYSYLQRQYKFLTSWFKYKIMNYL